PGGQTQFGLLQTSGATTSTGALTGPDGRTGTNGTILTQPLNLAAGQTVSLNYNFLTGELVDFPGYFFTDFARGDVIDNSGNVVGTLFNANTQTPGFISAAGSGFSSQTGWQTSATIAAPADGIYALRFVVSNVGDTFVDSALGLDNLVLSNAT